MILGDSKVNPERMTEMLNEFGRQGWRVVTMERESRRSLLFFNREAFLIVLERQIGWSLSFTGFVRPDFGW